MPCGSSRAPLEGYWFNRRKEWAARNRGQDDGTYDFATHYLVHFAQLPAFRDLLAEAVAGVEEILNQNPFELPTRRPKRSPKPLFHVASKQVRNDLRSELAAFLALCAAET